MKKNHYYSAEIKEPDIRGDSVFDFMIVCLEKEVIHLVILDDRLVLENLDKIRLLTEEEVIDEGILKIDMLLDESWIVWYKEGDLIKTCLGFEIINIKEIFFDQSIKLSYERN